MFFSSKSLTELGIDFIRISPPFSRDLLKLGDALLVCMGILSLLLLLLQLGKCTVAFRYPRCLMIVMQKNVFLFTWLPFTDLLPSARYNHILRILRICTYLKVRLTQVAFASERPYRRTIIRASRDFVCIETHTLRNVILTGTASFSACYATYHHMLKGSSNRTVVIRVPLFRGRELPSNALLSASSSRAR